MMIDPLPPLSPAGVRRREAILRLARASARGRRRRRLAMRAAVVAAAVVVAATASLRSHRGEPSPTPVAWSPQPLPTTALKPQVVTGPPQSRVVITRVETDPDLLRRWKVLPRPPAWQWLTDDDLFRALDDAGRPAGLINIDGRTMLVYRDGGKGPPLGSERDAPAW